MLVRMIRPKNILEVGTFSGYSAICMAEGLEEGSVVTAGDVIGYMGHTGYSTTENVNNIEVTHLHWGLELVFDEEQKESDNEIWIDVYPLTCFLAKHTQEVQKVEGTREWIRTTKIREF